jgi:hypothetical protein
MAIVVRLGPVPLQHRRAGRIAELERIFGTTVELVEVSTTAELVTALATPGVIGVALDAAPPRELAGTAAAAHPLPVLRPLWRRQRNARGEMDEVFEGYGLLSGMDVVRLADGELST